MSFNERVRKVIKGEAETKSKVVTIFSTSVINGSGVNSITPGATTVGLTQPNLLETLAIAQGDDNEQREGNKIENCKLRVRGVISSRPYDETTNPNKLPFEVHMVAYKLKSDINNDVLQLKTLPGDTTGIVNGSLINTMYPYNKDKYIFRKLKVFRLRPLPQSVQPAADNVLINAQTSNAPMFHRFVETIDIHKDLKYNSGSTTPANDWCGITFFVINADGSTNSANQSRAQVTMDALLTYKDI